MYPRNAASPERIAVGAVVQISDGAVQTSGVSIKVKPQGTTASAGGGTTSYEEGIVAYVPTQAETDYTSFQVIAYKTGCIPVAVTVVTSASATAGYGGVDWGKVTNATSTVGLSGTTVGTITTYTGNTPQTGDAFARLGAPAGASVSADVAAVKADTAAILLDTGTDGVVVAAGSKTGYSLSATQTFDLTGNITGNLSGSVGSVTGAVGSVTGNVGGNVAGAVGSVTAAVTVGTINSGAITATSIAADAITAAKVASDVSAEIADAVWDEILSGHSVSGSTGEALSAAGGAGDPWITALPGSYSSGQAGHILGTYLDAAISTRSTYAGGDTAGTTTLLSRLSATRAGYLDNLSGGAVALASSILDAAGLRSALGLASANLDTQLGALPTANENADALLDRNVAGGSSTGRTVKQALYLLRNKWIISGGTLTVYGTDDVTSAWTASVTQTAGDPVSASDPA